MEIVHTFCHRLLLFGSPPPEGSTVQKARATAPEVQKKNVYALNPFLSSVFLRNAAKFA